MAAGGAAGLVAAWASAADEGGRVEPLVAALAAPAAGPAPSPAACTAAAWDRALLDLLAAVLPRRRLDGVADCPGCGQRLDVELALPPPGDGSAPGPPAPPSAVRLRHGGQDVLVTARAPTVADLDAALAAAGGEPAGAIAALVERIVVAVDGPDGEAVRPSTRAAVLARPDLLVALDAAVGRAEAPAVEPVPLRCPECGRRWSADVALDAFAWSAVERAATGLLGEVHRLAAAYGWSHDEVLALPDPVRRHYLRRVRT